ncbi:MAG: DUF2061 domain-containing protein [Kiritimatiellae bacterium]|nr:DUF2061 domain-containing protein [Kiritimatiellia bacterium]
MDSHYKTLAKTISWRILATLITGTIAWLITGETAIGITIGLADSLIKMLIYYGHERVWTHSNLGNKK